MTQPETLLVGRIRRAILEVYPDCWVVKVHGGPYQDAGIPDLLGCIDGLMFGLEVKRQRIGESVEHALGRTTARQSNQLGLIRKAGGLAATILSEQEALSLLEEALRSRLDTVS